MEIKNMNRGVLGRLIAVVAIALCCVVALPAAAYAEDVPEDKTEFHITNRNDFLAWGGASRPPPPAPQGGEEGIRE